MSRSPVTLRWLASKRLSCLLAGLFLGWTGNLTAEPGVDFTSLFTYSVPLNQTGAGSFSVTASVGGVETEFLLDTGATMVTVTSSLFKKIREQGSVVQVRKVGHATSRVDSCQHGIDSDKAAHHSSIRLSFA